MGITITKNSRDDVEFRKKNALSLNDFAAIENNILIGLADKDNMVSLDETLAVYKQLKNGATYMLSNTKHPIETVNVGILAKIITEFN